MAISALLTLAGNALAPAARDVVQHVAEGLSFQNLLGREKATSTDGGHDMTAPDHPKLPPSPEAAQLAAIQRQPLEELQAYVDRLRDRLSAAGIDLSETISLKVGSRGEIQVDGTHPHRAEIEELLAGDARLTSNFRLLSNVMASQFDPAAGDRTSRELRLTIDAASFDVALD